VPRIERLDGWSRHETSARDALVKTPPAHLDIGWGIDAERAREAV